MTNPYYEHLENKTKQEFPGLVESIGAEEALKELGFILGEEVTRSMMSIQEVEEIRESVVDYYINLREYGGEA